MPLEMVLRLLELLLAMLKHQLVQVADKAEAAIEELRQLGYEYAAHVGTVTETFSQDVCAATLIDIVIESQVA